jgi:D-alanyl-D-alanine carboxypeptidase (penicillin-binding protein 5/6)
LRDLISRAAGRLAAALLAAVLVLAAPLAAQARGGAEGSKFAAIAIDANTGRVLYANHADARRFPASLTKVMTLYLAFDALDRGRLRPGDRIVMSRHAAAQAPVKLGLPPGRSLTVEEALDIIVVRSDNDVAVALAERLAGDERTFVRRMNRKARALGMRHTHFANASGLPDPNNVTTARDLALLARALIRNHPARYDLFDKEQAAFRGRTLRGHNRLLSRRGVDGIKTGYTRASGYNLMTSGVRNGRRVIAVVLGGRTAASRDAYMGDLLKTSFQALAPAGRHTAEYDRDRGSRAAVKVAGETAGAG